MATSRWIVHRLVEESRVNMNKFCPGSIAIKTPMPETVECSRCHGEVEIWTDEIKTVCPNCKSTVFKDRLPSCVDWCKFAEKCVGADVLKRLKGEVEGSDGEEPA